jgi:hypothetical protein
MSKPLVPTVGRRMYFFCSVSVCIDQELICLDPAQPFDAGVIYIINDSTVNVLVTDHEGNMVTVTECPVCDREYAEQANLEYWVEWMPYQKAQAAKDAAVETTSIGLSYGQTGGE